MALIAQPLKRSEARDWYGGSRLKRYVRRFQRYLVFGRARVLGKCARSYPEYFVPWLKLRNVHANRFNHPRDVGSERLLWGSEAALSGGPMPYLKAFMEMQMPADLREGFGYPEITRHDRENILGLNFARLMGVDVEAKKRELGQQVSSVQ